MTSSPKVALVTAGSAGLGAAIVRSLYLEAGMSVVVNYANNAQRAEDFVQELRKEGSKSENQKLVVIKADLSNRSDIGKLVDETVSSLGQLDVVVSNVGWTRMTNFMDLEEGMVDDDWDKCFNVNVKSHLYLFHAARKHLDESEGCFIATASVAGIKPSGSSLPYSVTKAALIHLMKGLAVIAAPKIRVNCVSPGLLLTEWGLKFPQKHLDRVQQANKLQRFATVEDVADQVKLYALSKSVTGQNAIIDAGFSL